MLSLIGFIKGQWYAVARRRLEWRCSRQPLRLGLARSDWEQSLQNPTAFYFECLRYFYQELPEELRAHRRYFQDPKNRRGFGENPFHVMWFLLFKEFRPSNFLEIGVFRGQTISLAALCAQLSNLP